MDIEKEITVLKNIVRVGTVSSVDIAERTARVAFADKKAGEEQPLISGALKALNKEIPYVGQFVICLFLPNGDGDGFILGEV